ncbi:MAG: class I SAM-dependent methyltransferase [Magnetococcales bacterium]|nr:class I SAM-dependent methyltransferase [Magnetococcales bacterium]
MTASCHLTTPRAFLRWQCVASLLREWPPGRFLEMGAGRGDFTACLLAQGFSGVCYDLGADNRQHLKNRFPPSTHPLQVVEDLQTVPEASFDYLLAFEVLEHIPNDAETLNQWLGHLRPGGRILLSVPAHQRKFDREDHYNGHVRRYEKAQLHALLTSNNIHTVQIVNYGFPLTNLLRLFNPLLFPSRTAHSQEERSIKSGLTRRCDRFLPNKNQPLPDFLLRACARLQRPFFDKDIGDGYVATGVKPA